jgi:hypothetical protein
MTQDSQSRGGDLFIVDNSETDWDDIPAAVPSDELEKKRKIPAAVKRIRGKLNVPRERFRVTSSGGYVWAGVK